ncbi:carbohydrate ABC transporter permease [Tsukamurella paurometabola]|nr:carbohydrate ABC transporter permease [Tsukamurella paurometabola]
MRRGRSRSTAATARTVATQLLLVTFAIVWMAPLAWAVYSSFRDYDYVQEKGQLSTGGYTLENYANAWTIGNIPHFFLNSVLITVPAVILILALGSMAAFVIARYSWKLNIAALLVFVTANLLPPQTLLAPLFRMFNAFPLPEWLSSSGSLYDTYWGVIIANLAFQLGFCVFVLSNYMKMLPKALTEAAEIDGAGAFRQYAQIILPLCRPALAALATLFATWVYNDFFWALALMVTADKYPVTTALQSLEGAYFTDSNMMSAGAVLVALPTVLVYMALQRHFISGLTMGANK